MKFITDAVLFTATFVIMITPTALTVGIIYLIFKQGVCMNQYYWNEQMDYLEWLYNHREGKNV